MNEKTTIRFVLTGVKYSQSDLGKHYKTFCGLYNEVCYNSVDIARCLSSPPIPPVIIASFCGKMQCRKK